MEQYDVVIIGGGIAGSVAAKFAAQGGLKTLFVEKYKTPREKPCSGIQFPYFEKILGEKIPVERLCNINLNKVKMILPNEKSIRVPFGMLNFMRKPFDHWLNLVAQEKGAKFIDECDFKDLEEFEDHVIVHLTMKDKSIEKIQARYVIDASGLRPKIRMKLRPTDFKERPCGATLNYYIDGTTDLDPHTLHQFWNLDWNDVMFAWVYMKTLDDGKDYWVIGTGCTQGKVLERQALFYEYIKNKYNVKGEIYWKEGYSSNIDINSNEKVWLGQNRILMVGDAAGLIDPVRGVGMDAAALSGRFAAAAILEADRNGTNALDEYTKISQKLCNQTRKNQQREITAFKTNDELLHYLTHNMAKTGIGMIVQNVFNKFRPVENFVMMPP